MATADLWVVIDRSGEVLRVYDQQARAHTYIESGAGGRGCGVVLVGARHPQYERLAHYETGLVLDGYGPRGA